MYEISGFSVASACRLWTGPLRRNQGGREETFIDT